jgi:hypothetical protein
MDNPVAAGADVMVYELKAHDDSVESIVAISMALAMVFEVQGKEETVEDRRRRMHTCLDISYNVFLDSGAATNFRTRYQTMSDIEEEESS